MEMICSIGFLVGGYGWKLWTDTRRSGHLRIGILIGCVLCALAGSIAIVIAKDLTKDHFASGGSVGVLAACAGFFLGGLAITVTNVLDHDFLRDYGPVRKFLFWYRNIGGLVGNALMGLILVAVCVTMAVTTKVSAEEKLFEAKQMELEKKVNEDTSNHAVPVTKHHHHHHHAVN